MAVDYGFQKWTAPLLGNLTTADAAVLRTIFASLSGELARISNLFVDVNTRLLAAEYNIAATDARVTSLRTAVTTIEALLVTCCAATTTPAPTTTTVAPVTTTTTAAPGVTTTTTAAPATTTTTVATTTTTVAPGPSCTSCTSTAVSEYRCNGTVYEVRYGTAYDGTCQPPGCVGCNCPVITIWGAWQTASGPNPC